VTASAPIGAASASSLTGFVVRQPPRGPRLDDVAGEVQASLAGLDLARRVRRGDTVAVTAGSRGITDIAVVLRAIVEHVRALGADPFLVPAMGSHGGGTAEGQARILTTYGLTADVIGCAVRSSMDVVEVGRSRFGFPVVTDALAAGADHVVVCNRVKPHTLFAGTVESGLVKMLLIGLGKQVGATTLHRAIAAHGWQPVVDDVTPILTRGAKVLAGVAIVERSDDATARVVAVDPDAFLPVEPGLLVQAASWMPRLPFPSADLLLVDRIGKDVSGAGLDVNVVGRKGAPHEPDPHGAARIGTIAVRGLTPATDGNAIGIGLAELCRTRVVEAMDPAITRLNALTALHLPAAMVPLDYATDAAMIDTALALQAGDPARAPRVQWIRDTRDLDQAWCSAAYRTDADERDDLEVVSDLAPLPLGSDGNLPDVLPA
jgi:hypothetical protein